MNGRPSSRRVVALLVLGAVAIGGALALSRRAEKRDRLRHFGARVVERLERGEYAGAFGLLDEAAAEDPKEAWLYRLLFTARFNRHWFERQLGAVSVLRALAENPPAASPPARYPEPLAGAPEGLAEILYVAGPAGSPYSALFPEAAAMLGKASVDVAAGAPAEAWQRVVVAPQEDLPVPDSLGSVLFLGPNRNAEKALGLRRLEGRHLEGCVLRSDAPGMAPLSTFNLAVPFDAAATVYADTSGLDVLAGIECPGGRYPGLLASRTKPRRLLFTFSLPALVVRLRQGDPRLAGRETDGIPGVRASDLFSRRRTLEELTVPEADLLLVSVLSLLEQGEPALRLWPHPAGALSTLVTTSDQDFEDESQIRILTSALARLGAAPTVYLTSDTYQPNGGVFTTDPSPAFVRASLASGIDFGPHTYFFPWGERLPDQHAPSPESVLAEHRDLLRAHYGLTPLSTRFHYIQWWGYVDPVRAEAAAGYLYDLNFLTMHSATLGGLGYMTGSGFPLRFYDEKGQPIAVRQLATELDDHANPYAAVAFPKIDRVRFMDATKDLIQSSAERFHSPLVVNNHPVHFLADPDWLISLIANARQGHVATLNVAAYDAFLRGLTDSRFRRLDAHRIQLSVLNESQDLLLLNTAGRAVTIDDRPAHARQESRYGQEALVVTVKRGHHTVTLP